MRRPLLRILGWTLSLLAVVCLLAFCELVLHRYPTEEEVKERLGKPGSTEIVIDATQSDIGYFGIRIGYEEEFFIETFKQWVLPGSKYDWNKMLQSE